MKLPNICNHLPKKSTEFMRPSKKSKLTQGSDYQVSKADKYYEDLRREKENEMAQLRTRDPKDKSMF